MQYEKALLAAEQAYRSGELETSLEHLARAAALASGRALPHLLAGEIFVELGRREQAIAAFRRAVELDPSDPSLLRRHRELVSHRRAAPIEAPDTFTAEAVSGHGQAQRLSLRSVAIHLVPYLVLITIAEYAVTFINPILVFPMHGGMVAIMAAHVAALEHRANQPSDRYIVALLLSLMLSPLIRIISLTLPLAQLPSPYQYLFAGIPMLIGALMVARHVGFRARSIGLVWRDTPWQAVAVFGSIWIGTVEYLILRPEALGAFPWTAAGWMPALTVAFATGFPEELIFRGMMQTAARPLIGTGWNVIYVSLVFAVLHMGYRSGLDLVFVFGASLFYGWIFERSRSIIGVAIGHGLANAVLFFVAPNVL